MSKTDQLTRRDALKLGFGVGAVALGLDACGMGADRCPPGPVVSGGSPGLLSGIDTIVVVMMENRSFDHLLGGLATDPSYPGAKVVDGLTGTETNLDSAGLPVTVNLAPGESSKLDPKHDWDSSHRAF